MVATLYVTAEKTVIFNLDSCTSSVSLLGMMFESLSVVLQATVASVQHSQCKKAGNSLFV